MRTLALLLAAALLSGCSSLDDPELRVSPYLAVYQLRGETGMQSVDSANPPALQDNPQQPLRSFGQDRFREDVGVRVDFGDGFGGLRADYYKLDMNTSRRGTLEHDWGRLLEGDMVRIYAEMDELRAGYLAPFADFSFDYRERDVRVQLAAGGVFASRRMRMRGNNEDNSRQQNLEINGDVIYGAIRARIGYGDVSLDVDYAIAPEDLVLSGDLEDVSQDLEARVTYQLPQRDIQIFAGVRYSELQSSGEANGFRHMTDMVIDGIQLGVSVTF
ncbi:MAG: hypothetical protein AB8H80_06750 [Planctomycetota bacterium]